MRPLQICFLGALLVQTACTVDVADPMDGDDLDVAGLTAADTVTRVTTAAPRPDVEAPTPDQAEEAEEAGACFTRVVERFQDELYNDDPSIYARIEDACSGAVVAVNLHFANYEGRSGSVHGVFDLEGVMGEFRGEWKDTSRDRIYMWVEGWTDDARVHIAGSMQRQELQPHNLSGYLELTR